MTSRWHHDIDTDKKRKLVPQWRNESTDSSQEGSMCIINKRRDPNRMELYGRR